MTLVRNALDFDSDISCALKIIKKIKDSKYRYQSLNVSILHSFYSFKPNCQELILLLFSTRLDPQFLQKGPITSEEI